MMIHEIDPDAFFGTLLKVARQLSDKKGYARLMDEARAHAPVIDALLRQLAALFEMEPQPGRGDAIAVAHQPLVVLLALQQLEYEQKLGELAVRN